MEHLANRHFIKHSSTIHINESLENILGTSSGDEQQRYLKCIVLLCSEYGKHKVIRNILNVYPKLVPYDDILQKTVRIPNIETTKWLVRNHSQELDRLSIVRKLLDKNFRKNNIVYLKFLYPYDDVNDYNSLLGLYNKYQKFQYAFKVMLYDIYIVREKTVIENLKSGNQVLVLYKPFKLYEYNVICDSLSKIYNTWDQVLPLMKVVSHHIHDHKIMLLKQGIEIVKILEQLGLNEITTNITLSFCMNIVRNPKVLLGIKGEKDL